MLAPHAIVNHDAHMQLCRINYKKNRGPRKLGRLQLPAEIIGMIFSEIDDLKNVFSLGVTNTQLMILGEKRLRELMTIPSWRGDRIICLGDGAEDNDLPEGLMTQECKDFLRDAPNLPELDKNDWLSNYGFIPVNFVDWVSDSRSGFQDFETKFLDKQRYALLENAVFLQYRGHHPRDKSDGLYSKIVDQLTSIERVFRVPDVLWNLSKKAYVLREAVLKAFDGTKLKGKKLEDTHVCAVMGNILQLQICWSSCDGTNLPIQGLHRGKWAGDRFEFTDESVLRLRLEDEDGVWTDASEEVIGKFLEVYEAEFGEDWVHMW